jgi:hypothetical protein
MKMRNDRLSGTFGNLVYLDSKHGHVVRSKSRRPWRATVGRLGVQRTPGIVAAAWRQLTKPQYQRWVVAFQEFKRRLPKAIPCPKDVCHFFGKINGTLVSHGQLVEMEPPKFETIKPNPVGDLEILNRGEVITLRLSVPRAPAKFTFVLASPWCGRGIWTRGNKFAIIGRLPPPVRGYSEITDLYVQRFGVPPVGQRVFIRTRQMFGSWQDDSKETFADVPPPEGVEAVDS